MGKKKNKGGNSGGVYNNNNNNNENKNNENSNNDNNNNNNNENSNNNNNNKENNSNNNGGGGGLADYANIVLKVDHHCDGCAQRIRKNILSFPGVRIVELEGENKVKVVAMKNVDAVKLKEKVEKHLMKKIELISPQPPKKDEQKKDNKETATDKPKELPMATVTLKIPYHCHGCSEKTYKVLSTYKGVYEVKVEKDKDQVTVKGKVDVKKMVEDIRSKLKKRTVEIVPDKKQQDKKEGGEKDADKKQDKPGGGGGGPDGSKGKIEYYSAGAIYGDYYGQGYGYGPYGYAPVNSVFDTQVFSEENLNACSIM